MLIVFVTSKIITIDTILPILFEASQRNNQKIIVVVSRELGMHTIEKNVVINDAVNKIGFKFLFGGRYRVRWYKRIVGSIQLSLLFFAGIFGAKFIHFDTLPVSPIRVLSMFFSSRVFYSERDSIAHSFYLQSSNRKNKFGLFYTQGNYPVPLGGNIISYNKDRLYYYYGHKIHEKRNVYFLGPTRTRNLWRKYLYSKSNYYFNKFHKGVDLSNGLIFVILTYYGVDNFNEEDTVSQKKLRNNFENTVKVLSVIKGDTPVFLKPHHGTDLEYVNSVLSEYDGFHITYFHPSMLLQKARFVICNWYSTILADAYNLGVPTIEYTYYPNSRVIKKDSINQSMGSNYVDWFVYDDVNNFKEVVNNLINKDFNHKQQTTNNEDQDNTLLIDLCQS